MNNLEVCSFIFDHNTLRGIPLGWDKLRPEVNRKRYLRSTLFFIKAVERKVKE
jgi:hypothetical protein